MIIKNDWLDKEKTDYLYNKFLFNTPHMYGHSSLGNNNIRSFYNYTFTKEDQDIISLCKKIEKDFFENKKIAVLRAYINIQHFGMNGEFHPDDGDVTVLYFPCPTNTNKGFFQYKEKEEIISIPYVQNQIILFDASILHRGIAFDDFKPRITLAFKIKYKD
jgi:hypothetical protein